MLLLWAAALQAHQGTSGDTAACADPHRPLSSSKEDAKDGTQGERKSSDLCHVP